MTTVISDLLVEHVSIRPDRFGRQHPCLSLINEGQCNGDISQISLKTISDLERYDCYEGDVVDLVLSNGVVSHIEKKYAGARHPSEIDYDLETVRNGQCCTCKQPGLYHNNALYCINQVCTESNLCRTIYACTPKVLDLPLGVWDLKALQMKIGPQSPTPVADLLNGIDREELNGIIYDEEVDALLDVIARRHQQLHGIGYPAYVQNAVQGRHLAALSLRGLFKMHIKKLLKLFLEHSGLWRQLPDVLTDIGLMTGLGIPGHDARIIAEAATERYEEILSFAKL